MKLFISILLTFFLFAVVVPGEIVSKDQQSFTKSEFVFTKADFLKYENSNAEFVMQQNSVIVEQNVLCATNTIVKPLKWLITSQARGGACLKPDGIQNHNICEVPFNNQTYNYYNDEYFLPQHYKR